MINKPPLDSLVNFIPERNPSFPTQNDVEALSIAMFWAGNDMAFMKHSALSMSEAIPKQIAGVTNTNPPEGCKERPFTWGDFCFGYSSEAPNNCLDKAVDNQAKRLANRWQRLEEEAFLGPRTIPQQVRPSIKRMMSIEERAYRAYLKSMSTVEMYKRAVGKNSPPRIITMNASEVKINGNGKSEKKKRITLPTL